MAVGSSEERTAVSTVAATGGAERDVAAADVDDRRTGRWYGVTAFALLALGLGAVTGQASLLLASTFGVAFAGYGYLTAPPEVDLTLERTLDDHDPDEGDEVTVTVTVRNRSDRTLADLRLVDGVPRQLVVTEGSPRHATALRPGGEATFTYVVRARGGTHAFGPTRAVARDVSGGTERATAVRTETTLTCRPPLPTADLSFPLRAQSSQYTGRFPADSPGQGIEFYATREYRRGDPLSRIDWNRTARTGEFTTVEYRAERTVTVVLLIDARADAFRAGAPSEPSAVERSLDAARRTYVSLTEAGHAVGLSAFSSTDCWLAPGRGADHRVRTRALFGTHPALSTEPPGDGTNTYAAVQRLRGRLPADAQVVLFSPLCDSAALSAAIQLDAHGHRATVVAPDPTAADTFGHRFAALERSIRVARLRRRGIPVIEWDPDSSFERAIAEAQRRWSA